MRNTQSTCAPFSISCLSHPHIFCSPYSLQLSQYPAVFPARWTWPQKWRLWSSLTPQSGQTLQVGEWNENSAFVGIRTFWWGIEVGQVSCWKNTYDSTSLQKGLLWITNMHAVVSWLLDFSKTYLSSFKRTSWPQITVRPHSRAPTTRWHVKVLNWRQ